MECNNRGVAKLCPDMTESNTLSSVLETSIAHRPSFDLYSATNESDFFFVISLGQSFCYPIPSFDVLAVELRPMRIQGIFWKKKNVKREKEATKRDKNFFFNVCRLHKRGDISHI